jgi:hypothetical protein
MGEKVSSYRLPEIHFLGIVSISFANIVATTIHAQVKPSQVWSADGVALSSVQFSPDDRLVTSGGRIWSTTNWQSVG